MVITRSQKAKYNINNAIEEIEWLINLFKTPHWPQQPNTAHVHWMRNLFYVPLQKRKKFIPVY